MPRRITHVIYDLDGTLLDTEPLYRLATQEILDRYSVTLTTEIRAAMIGRPTPVAARVLVEMTGIPILPEAFAAERDERLVPLFATVQPTRGALELTAHLRAHSIPQAIATSSLRHSLEAKRVSQPEWFASFDTIVTAENIEHGKPAPDIFLEAPRRIGGTPGGLPRVRGCTARRASSAGSGDVGRCPARAGPRAPHGRRPPVPRPPRRVRSQRVGTTRVSLDRDSEGLSDSVHIFIAAAG